MHLAGGMALGKIELAEIVVVGLDVRPLGDRKTHVCEDRDQFLGNLGDGMDATNFDRRLAGRKRYVHGLVVEARIERGISQLIFAGRDRSAHALLESVDERPAFSSLGRSHRAQRLEQG